MNISEFKAFNSCEIINQLDTGINFINNPFEVKEPTKDLEPNTAKEVELHFLDSEYRLNIFIENGYTRFVIEKKFSAK